MTPGTGDDGPTVRTRFAAKLCGEVPAEAPTGRIGYEVRPGSVTAVP